MKKNILKGMATLAMIAIMAVPAFAAGTNGSWNVAATTTGYAITDTTGGGAGIHTDDLKFSVGVHYVYIASTDGNSFGLGTWNSKGTKVYATNSASSKLYVSSIDVETTTTRDTYDDFIDSSSTTWATTNWQEVGK